MQISADKKRVILLAVLVGLLGVAVFIMLSKSEQDDHIKDGEVVPALKKTGYRFKFRRIPPREGIIEAVAGRAFGPKGAEVDFIITVSNDDKALLGKYPLLVGYPYDSGSRHQNVSIETNAGNRGLARSETDYLDKIDMQLSIEEAVYSEMTDVPPVP